MYQPIEWIVGICVVAFALTVIVTFLGLFKVIRLPNDTFLPQLFKILVIEIAIVSTGAFSTVIADKLRSGVKDYVKIVSHTAEKTNKSNPTDSLYNITFSGAYFSEQTDVELTGVASFNGFSLTCSSDSTLQMDQNGTWNVTFKGLIPSGDEDQINLKIFLKDRTSTILRKDVYNSELEHRITDR